MFFFFTRSHRRLSMAKQRLEVSPSVYHPEDQHLLAIDTVHDDVLAGGEAPAPRAKVFVPHSSSRSVIESTSRLAISRLLLSVAT
jgi:hypothetical protein